MAGATSSSSRRAAFLRTCGAEPPCVAHTVPPRIGAFVQRSPVVVLLAVHWRRPWVGASIGPAVTGVPPVRNMRAGVLMIGMIHRETHRTAPPAGRATIGELCFPPGG